MAIAALPFLTFNGLGKIKVNYKEENQNHQPNIKKSEAKEKREES